MVADFQEDRKLYLQEKDVENFIFGGWECTLWTRVSWSLTL